MNKKLPHIFKNTDYSIINNNKKTFYSNREESFIKNNNYSNDKNTNTTNIKEEYLFNRLVNIKTQNENIKAKIVSKVGDHILTSTNKKILLSEIISITEA